MASSISVPCPKISSFLGTNQLSQTQRISLPLPQSSKSSSKSSLSFGSSILVPAFSRCQWSNGKQTTAFKGHAQLNEVAAEKSSNSIPVVDAKPKVELPKENDKSSENTIPDVAAISAFMTQVSDLVKLVDSRDITELQLKQSDCELVIRKKEALQPPEPAPPIVMPQYMPHAMFQTPPPAAPIAAPAPVSPATPAPAPSSPPPAKTGSSSHPAFKCPMAGTFYRSPAPGEPPFVKVGDKVQKGQVVCIIEAMKLMNEIEADQSGTISEILVEDGKSVSVDLPLFVIVP
ncbi:biotin carboxyl carrier protein of acetyl-CoA carboxylase, chloroplastic-like [Herrania umbratica]|uniref:Biotin carboxyl carrier protein of acetyl-CoA carboxylase n=1 Tax=Herrania umbratica TaxID=108875 RepID=A0A6J1BDR8_9ROSI|nr:biotin carboxyl carrier protein of acetyl-CoA carboxylase, chloroplastic-like [Herrania umbratica]